MQLCPPKAQCCGLLLSAWTALFLNHAWAEASANYLDVNLRQNRYLGAEQHAAQESNYTLLSAEMNLETQTEGFSYKLNVLGQGAANAQNELYYGVPELYVQPRQLAPWFNLTIGRQRRTWSRLDEEFNLGIWQPQLRWDYLDPVQEGLMGVFFDWSLTSALKLTFFTSPLLIPDQGPQFRMRDGNFESSNRWFVQPQSHVMLFGGTKYQNDAALAYELVEPSARDIFLHSSFGLGIHYQELASPFWAQINYAYKPRNQIHLGLECSHCYDISDPTAEITVLVHPRIIEHHVLTIETGIERIDDQAWISLTADAPERSGFPDAYEEAPLDPMVVVGASYQHYIYSWVRRPSWLRYSYMRAWAFRKENTSSLVGRDEVESSFDRYPFEEIAAADWKVQLIQKRKNQVFLHTRYSYSIPERGGWLSARFDWRYGAATWSLGADILGADVDPSKPEAGLFSRYRENDRVFGGMSYVF